MNSVQLLDHNQASLSKIFQAYLRGKERGTGLNQERLVQMTNKRAFCV